MTNDDFEDLMRDAARTYNRPLDLPRTEALWTAIERSLPAAAEPSAAQPSDDRPALAIVRGTDTASDPVAPRRAAWWTRTWTRTWLRTAAVLLIGVAIGRMSAWRPGFDAVRATATSATAAPTIASPAQVATTAYLGQTAALLTALAGELRGRQTDPAYISRADALLLQTRLLLDSPAASDPTLRSLFDDLEVVLAQVVRLNADRDQTRIDLLQQALEQRDVLPRLREAVAENAAD